MNPTQVSQSRHPIPGELLWHPLVLSAAVVIAINTFYLKVHYPGWWSGKLSDFGLCLFLPVWLFALFEWVTFARSRIRGTPWRPRSSNRVALVCCAMAGAYFSALQLWPFWADFHVAWLSLLVSGTYFEVTPDPTDLLALPFLAPAYLLVRRRRLPF